MLDNLLFQGQRRICKVMSHLKKMVVLWETCSHRRSFPIFTAFACEHGPRGGAARSLALGTTMIHNDSRRITNDPAMYSRCDQVEDTIAAKQSLLHPTNEHSPECHPRPTPLSNRVVHRARFCGFFVARPTACRRLEALEPFQGPS